TRTKESAFCSWGRTRSWVWPDKGRGGARKAAVTKRARRCNHHPHVCETTAPANRLIVRSTRRQIDASRRLFDWSAAPCCAPVAEFRSRDVAATRRVGYLAMHAGAQQVRRSPKP